MKRHPNTVSALGLNQLLSSVRGPRNRHLHSMKLQVIAPDDGNTRGPDRAHGVRHQIERAVLAPWIRFLVGTEVSAREIPPNTPRGPESAPGRLTARQSDGDVAHRGISLGPVPVALTRLDVSGVTDLDLKSFGFRGDPPAARGDDQNLIAIVNMPASMPQYLSSQDANLCAIMSPHSCGRSADRPSGRAARGGHIAGRSPRTS